ncbi:hypothetical protein [Halorarum halobium]|uniref:hypothetical protein n=1 Tax=Halorarum halobium TaxID=3075121 RepID=UPI0028AFD2EE|nr:hypothetical protein [Halobaculum sp. XH14]
MGTAAAVLFQQNSRRTATRVFKGYRLADVEATDRLVERLERYLTSQRFTETVDAPHWLDTGTPIGEATLPEFGSRLDAFDTFLLVAVTDRAVETFVGVPLAVDVLPALAEGIRVREYGAADRADGRPRPDATPARTFDADTFGPPLTGAAAEGGLLEWWHLFALQAGTRLRETPADDRETGPDGVATLRVAHGDGLVCVDLLDPDVLDALAREAVYVNVGSLGEHAADGGAGAGSSPAEGATADASLEEKLTGTLRTTATRRYRYARHLWAVRHGGDERLGDSNATLAEERETAQAHMLADLDSRCGEALGPFSGGSFGALLRAETATRPDTFALNTTPDLDRDTVASDLAGIDPDYNPEHDPMLR